MELTPISRQKEIKVSVTGVEPKPDEYDKEKGFRTWERTIEPRDKIELNIEFTVEYPPKKRVQGLF